MTTTQFEDNRMGASFTSINPVHNVQCTDWYHQFIPLHSILLVWWLTVIFWSTASVEYEFKYYLQPVPFLLFALDTSSISDTTFTKWTWRKWNIVAQSSISFFSFSSSWLRNVNQSLRRITSIMWNNILTSYAQHYHTKSTAQLFQYKYCWLLLRMQGRSVLSIP